MKKPIFRSAITDDNDDVDVGYLALIWGLIGWGASVLVVLAVGTITALREPGTGSETIQSMGVAVGAVSGGFATMLGAVGLFRLGDKPHAGAPGSTTTTKVETVATVDTIPTATGKPLAVAVVDMPAATAPPMRERKTRTKGKR